MTAFFPKTKLIRKRAKYNGDLESNKTLSGVGEILAAVAFSIKTAQPTAPPPPPPPPTSTKTGLKILLGVIILCIAIVFLIGVLYSVQQRSYSISEYVKDGEWTYRYYRGFASRLEVRLTSTNDYMSVEIRIDGKTVFENSRTYDVDFEYNMGFGWHEVYIIISNPTIFGLGKAIEVTGQVSFPLF